MTPFPKLIFLILLTSSPFAKSEPCTGWRCGNRGICVNDDWGNAHCHCYKQYYTGERCTIPTDHCKDGNTLGILKNCGSFTSKCVSSYGVNNCYCPYGQAMYGRYCDHTRQSSYDKNDRKRPVKEPVLVVPLEPYTGETLMFSAGCVDKGSMYNVQLIIHGVVHTMGAWQFKCGKNTREQFKGIRHLLKNESMFKHSKMCFSYTWDHFLISQGMNAMVLRVNYNPPEEKNKYYADYKFDYYAKSRKNDCKPRIAFVGATCSLTENKIMGFTLFDTIILQRYVMYDCNSTHSIQDNDLYLLKQPYGSHNNLPADNDVSKLSSKFDKKGIRDVLNLNLILGLERAKIHRKIFLIGTAFENVTASNNSKLVGKTGWAYCWLKYFDEKHMHPNFRIANNWASCVACKPKFIFSVYSLNDPDNDLIFTPEGNEDVAIEPGMQPGVEDSKIKMEWRSHFYEDKLIKSTCDLGYRYCQKWTGYRYNNEKTFENCINYIPAGQVVAKHVYSITQDSWFYKQYTTQVEDWYRWNNYTNYEECYRRRNPGKVTIANFNSSLDVAKWDYPSTEGYLVAWLYRKNIKEKEIARNYLFFDVYENRVPALRYVCRENCGTGYTDVKRRQPASYNYYADRHSFTVLEAACDDNCDLIEDPNLIDWSVNDDTQESVFYYPIPDGQARYLAVIKHSLKTERSTEPIKVQIGWKRRRHSEWYYYYYPRRTNPGSDNDYCDKSIYSVKGLGDEIELCNIYQNMDEYQLNMFYQPTPSYISKTGILLGYSHTPKIYRVWVPITEGRALASFKVTVFDLISKATDELPYHASRITVNLPNTMMRGPVMAINFVQRLVNGKEWGVSSIEFDRINLNVFYLIQKTHVFCHEVVNVGLGMSREDNTYIIAQKIIVLTTILKQFEQFEPKSILEIIQTATVAYEILALAAVAPLSVDMTDRFANIYEKQVNAFETLRDGDDLFNYKFYRVKSLISTLFDMFAGISQPVVPPPKDKLTGDEALKAVVVTKDEVTPTVNVSILEFYEDYGLLAPEEQLAQDKLRSAGRKAYDSVVKLLGLLDNYAKHAFGEIKPDETKSRYAYFPPIFTHDNQPESRKSSSVGLNRIILQVRAISAQGIIDEENQNPVLRFHKAMVVFRSTRELSNMKHVLTYVMITETQPFWWHPSSKYCLNTAVYVNAKSLTIAQLNKTRLPKATTRRAAQYGGFKGHLDGTPGGDVETLFDAFYVIEKVKWFEGTASHSLFMYVVEVTPKMPPTVMAVFDEVPGSVMLKVYLRNEQPESGTFNMSSEFVLVGKKRTWVVNTTLTRNRGNKTIQVYLAIQPVEDVAAPYKVSIMSVGCMTWNETKDITGDVFNRSWTSDNGCTNMNIQKQFHVILNEYGVACTCPTQDTKAFTAAVIPLEAKILATDPIRLNIEQESDFTISITLFFLLMIFFLMLLIAYFFDKRDSEPKRPIYLISNRPGETYPYVIVTITGGEHDSGTSSHVGIKIFGTRGNSKRHVLFGPFDETIFKQRRVDFFFLMTEKRLGNILAVEVWVDVRGRSPQWKLDTLMVRDYCDLIEWVFIVRKWFSLIRGDAHIHRILYQTKQKLPSIKEKVFSMEDFYNQHIWFGMFVREHCHSFSRMGKVLSGFTLLLVACAVAFHSFGVAEYDSLAVLDEGSFHLSYAIANGITGSIFGMLLVYPITYAMKNANPDPHYSYMYVDYSGTDPTGPHPVYLFKYTVRFTMVCLHYAFMTIASLLMIMYGFKFGRRKSQMWVGSVLTIIILQIVIVETAHVYVRAFVVYVLLRVPRMRRFCNEIIDLTVGNQRKYATPIVKKALLKKDMFYPVPRQIRRVLKLKEENFSNYYQSFWNFFFFLLLLINNVILFNYFHIFESAFSTQIMKKMVIDDAFTRTFAFDSIESLDDVIFYLNNTIPITLYWYKPAFTVNAHNKLLGPVRVRQLKMKPKKDRCAPPIEITIIRRCEKEFEESRMDKTDYMPHWAPYNGSEPPKTPIANAFLYERPSKANIFSKRFGYKSIPGGGYITFLGRTPINHRKSLLFLKNGLWFHKTTRFIFIDFVTYNAGANLFNIVCLMIQISMTGDVEKYYSINTLRAFDTNPVTTIAQYLLFALLCAQAFNVIMRNISQVQYCYKNIQAFQDCFVIVLAISTLAMYAYRYIRLQMVVELINRTQRNIYVNIEDVIWVEYYSTLTTALWCSQNMIHLIDIGQSNSHIRVFYYTVLYAMEYIYICVALTLCFLLPFAVAFHFLLAQENYLFRNFALSFIQVFGIPFLSKRPIDFEYTTPANYVPYWLFTFYGYSFRFLIGSMFTIVLVNSYHRARLRTALLCFKYTMHLYFKERLFRAPIKFDKERVLPIIVPLKHEGTVDDEGEEEEDSWEDEEEEEGKEKKEEDSKEKKEEEGKEKTEEETK